MLGWMLRRGENVPDSMEAGDTTQADMPDTPAPVFAARAFNRALFGTPQAEPRTRVRKASATASAEDGTHTPKSKPQGILLTPGTGTTRPKRVSFGSGIEKSTNTQQEALVTENGGEPKRTRLNEALQSARQGKANKSEEAKAAGAVPKEGTSDDDWEEDDGPPTDEEDYCNHDITIDVDEPHSRSGKYWKEEFQKYHRDAKAELDKMVRYKKLAKEYAQHKDSEALALAEKLRKEQEKVIKMEKKIAENASNILAQHDNPAQDATPEVVSKLSKQTALAIEYRQRVKELEDQLEEFLQDKQDEAETKGRRSRHAVASPRTQKTLLETQRELRRARSQVREANGLRDQVSSLKKQLREAEKRAAKAELGVKHEEFEPSRVTDLRAQLRESRQECKSKDEEIARLRDEFDAFQKESQKHDEDTKAVLERAHNKIADLKKEVKNLKAGQMGKEHGGVSGLPDRPRSWDSKDHVYEPVQLHGGQSEAGGSRKSNRKSSSGSGGQRGDACDKARTLRDKYQDDGNQVLVEPTEKEPEPNTMSGALGDRPSLEKPRWQPFVPRSPRNRAYLGEELSNRIRNGGTTPAAAKTREVDLQDLSALAKKTSKYTEEPDDERLQSRFVRLGGPDGGNPKQSGSSTNRSTSKSRLPPERRAAALARIEQRRAEKLKERARSGVDKENVRPGL